MDIELSTENRFYRDSHSSDEEREKSGIVCGGKWPILLDWLQYNPCYRYAHIRFPKFTYVVE